MRAQEFLSEATVRDQILSDFRKSGGNIDDYYVRFTDQDKLGYSAKQSFGRSPDVDDPAFNLDYIGYGKGRPALWFYPLSYYLRNKDDLYATKNPHAWLVRLKPNAWLQTVNNKTREVEPAPQGQERVGILRLSSVPAAIFFKPAFDLVGKYYDYAGQHQRHGQVNGQPKPTFMDRLRGVNESTDFTNAVNSIEKLVKQNNIKFQTYEDLLRFVASRKFLQAQHNDQKFVDDVARAVLRRLHQAQLKEYVNKKVLTTGWKDTQSILDGRYRLEAEVREWAKKPTLFVHVYDDQATDWEGNPKLKEVGYTRFVSRGLLFKDLVASMVYVNPEYRRQGIASAMYKYAHGLGNTVKPSTAQLAPGKELWRNIKAKGGVEKLEEINDDDELSVSQRIQDYFTNRGYGYLGEGRDQIAFLSPRGTVVKVVGIGEDEREDIVKTYVGFFLRNQRNPHYPRIYNAGDFAVDGETYFVYEMEYLHPVSGEDRVLEYIEDLMSALPRGEQALAAFYQNKKRPPELSEQQVDGLVIATQDLEDAIGGQAPLDLRSIENLGRRKDGQIVIIDPFSL